MFLGVSPGDEATDQLEKMVAMKSQQDNELTYREKRTKYYVNPQACCKGQPPSQQTRTSHPSPAENRSQSPQLPSVPKARADLNKLKVQNWNCLFVGCLTVPATC